MNIRRLLRKLWVWEYSDFIVKISISFSIVYWLAEDKFEFIALISSTISVVFTLSDAFSLKLNISKSLSLLKCMRFLIPKKYREEWIGDLMETVNIMKAEGQPIWWICLVIFLQVLIVVYHAVVFKLSEYFSTDAAKQSKKRRT